MPLPPSISDNSVTLTFGPAGVYYGYATIADVTFEFPDKSSYTTLSNSTIAQEITYAARELEALLATRYQMPYTGTDGGVLLDLRNLNAKLATANIIDRYFQGSEPNLSPMSAERRSWVELVVKDVLDGVIQWSGTGFGDAVPNPEKPTYPTSKGATILTDPATAGEYGASPVFVMGRSRYRGGSLF